MKCLAAAQQGGVKGRVTPQMAPSPLFLALPPHFLSHLAPADDLLTILEAGSESCSITSWLGWVALGHHLTSPSLSFLMCTMGMITSTCTALGKTR